MATLFNLKNDRSVWYKTGRPKIGSTVKITIYVPWNRIFINQAIGTPWFHDGERVARAAVNPPIFKWRGKGGMRNVCRASIIQFDSIASFGTAPPTLPVAFIDKRDKCAHRGRVSGRAKKTNDFRWRLICVGSARPRFLSIPFRDDLSVPNCRKLVSTWEPFQPRQFILFSVYLCTCGKVVVIIAIITLSTKLSFFGTFREMWVGIIFVRLLFLLILSYWCGHWIDID